ncbi:hypothetical protein [uncultured Massilia sp.]|uniref:hypothetical protein n=1 Tax=uncultured Massilia sp. TaxID=169973 RepID=UPI0025E4F52C|nr:hypothetical protein [uncultured Massilia sp.]
MKRTIGWLMWVGGCLVVLATLYQAGVYAFGFHVWMQAPLGGVLAVVAVPALPLIALGWACARIGRRLRRGQAAVAMSGRAWKWTAIGGGAVVALAAVVAGRMAIDSADCRALTGTERRRDGVDFGCVGRLAHYDIGFRSLAAGTRDLAFAPVDLRQTPFARLESLGARSERSGDVRSRLYRGFRTPDGHRVTLSEHDMSADGSNMWRAPADEPERIRGMPARLSVFRDTAGTTVSHLSWVEGRRSYELWIDAPAVRGPVRDQLFALAASLPKAVPACPNEVPPRPLNGLDAEPFDDVPPVLLAGEVGARPCK